MDGSSEGHMLNEAVKLALCLYALKHFKTVLKLFYICLYVFNMASNMETVLFKHQVFFFFFLNVVQLFFQATFGLTLLVYGPLLWKIWRAKDHHGLAFYVALGSAIAFTFGWHVHEKAQGSA